MAPPKATTGKKTVDGYVATLGDWRGAVVGELLAIIRGAAPDDATASIKWAQPVFEHNGPFAYVRAFSKHVNLGFWRGAELAHLDPRLQSGGQQMAHIKISAAEEVDPEAFAALVAAAVELNLKLGSPTKRS